MNKILVIFCALADLHQIWFRGSCLRRDHLW